MSLKIAVLGTGANGSCISASLIDAGLDVTLIDQWPAHVEAMRLNGLTITMPDKTTDDDIVTLFEKQGCFRAIPGAGHGALTTAYKPEPYPEGADMKIVTEKGDAVGDLGKLRVDGKYTVLDFYADWCGPCRLVDGQLRELVGTRDDIAVRKLNVVGFESPLAKQMGRKLKALPYVVVYAPDGKKTEITGHNPDKLADALDIKE